MIRELRYPVPKHAGAGAGACVVSVEISAAPRSPEYFVILYDDARDLYGHPTRDVVVAGDLFRLDQAYALRLLRGLID